MIPHANSWEAVQANEREEENHPHPPRDPTRVSLTVLCMCVCGTMEQAWQDKIRDTERTVIYERTTNLFKINWTWLVRSSLFWPITITLGLIQEGWHLFDQGIGTQVLYGTFLAVGQSTFSLTCSSCDQIYSTCIPWEVSLAAGQGTGVLYQSKTIMKY